MIDATAGALAVIDAGTRLDSAHVVHNAPRGFTGDTVTWTVRWTAPSTDGVATLSARGLSSDGALDSSGDRPVTGALMITVSAPPPPPADDCLGTLFTTCTVTPNGPAATGTIEFRDDEDWFSFQATAAGSTCTLRARGADTGSGTLVDPALKLVDELGNPIADSRDNDGGTGRDARVSVTLATAGIYFVVVDDFRSGVGTYELDILETGAVRACVDPFSRGDCMVFESDVADFAAVAGPCSGGTFDDCISSIELVPNSTMRVCTDAVGSQKDGTPRFSEPFPQGPLVVTCAVLFSAPRSVQAPAPWRRRARA